MKILIILISRHFPTIFDISEQFRTSPGPEEPQETSYFRHKKQASSPVEVVKVMCSLAYLSHSPNPQHSVIQHWTSVSLVVRLRSNCLRRWMCANREGSLRYNFLQRWAHSGWVNPRGEFLEQWKFNNLSEFFITYCSKTSLSFKVAAE